MMWWAVFFMCGLLFPSQSILAPAGVFGGLICIGYIRCKSCDLSLLRKFMIVAATSLLLYSGAGNKLSELESSPEGHTPTEFCLHACENARTRLLDSLDDPRLSEESRSFLAALLLGSRDRLGYELREAYSYLGIAHFLALSGLHLGIILIPLSRIISLAPLDRRVRYFVIFCFVLAYAAVARFPASLVRASALTGAFLLMRSLGRKTTLMRALITGCLVVTALDRRVVFDARFQLSFTAVCGIALVAIPLMSRIKRLLPANRFGKVLRIAATPLIVTVSINAFTLPLVLSLFDRAPLLAPLFNILMIVPVTVTLYLGTCYFLIPADPIRSILAVPINGVAYLLWNIPLRLSRAPQPALFCRDVRNGIYIAGLSLLILALRGGAGRSRYVLGISMLLISASLFAGFGRSAMDHDAEAVIERMSKGSILVSSGTNLLIVDGYLNRFESTQAVRMLWARGIREVDLLVICPASARDLRGIEHLASRVSIRRALCNPYLSGGSTNVLDILYSKGITVYTLLEDLSIDLGRTLILLHAPPYPPEASQPVTNSEARVRYRLLPGNHERENAN